MTAPANEAELLQRCRAIEGVTFAQLAAELALSMPLNPSQRKGWLGQAVELALGTTAKNLSQPDFCQLGIELKTLPIASTGKPAESTFVTRIPLLTIHQQTWLTSQCFAKLQRVLWLPIEGDPNISFGHRRIGRAILWSPSAAENAILAADWQLLTEMMTSGRLAEVDAKMGQYLQVRPKARDGKSLCYGYDEMGERILTLPRGFYLRSLFTEQLLSS